MIWYLLFLLILLLLFLQQKSTRACTLDKSVWTVFVLTLKLYKILLTIALKLMTLPNLSSINMETYHHLFSSLWLLNYHEVVCPLLPPGVRGSLIFFYQQPVHLPVPLPSPDRNTRAEQPVCRTQNYSKVSSPKDHGQDLFDSSSEYKIQNL